MDRHEESILRTSYDYRGELQLGESSKTVREMYFGNVQFRDLFAE